MGGYDPRIGKLMLYFAIQEVKTYIISNIVKMPFFDRHWGQTNLRGNNERQYKSTRRKVEKFNNYYCYHQKKRQWEN